MRLSAFHFDFYKPLSNEGLIASEVKVVLYSTRKYLFINKFFLFKTAYLKRLPGFSNNLENKTIVSLIKNRI